MSAVIAQNAPTDRPRPRSGPGRPGGPGGSGLIKPTMADTIKVSVYADNWFVMFINGKLAFEQARSFIPEPVGNRPRTGAVIVIDLAAGPIQESVMVEQMQRPEHLLSAAGQERGEMIRPKESVPVDLFENLPVARRQPHRHDAG